MLGVEFQVPSSKFANVESAGAIQFGLGRVFRLSHQASNPIPIVAKPSRLSKGRRAMLKAVVPSTLNKNSAGTQGQPGTRRLAPS